MFARLALLAACWLPAVALAASPDPAASQPPTCRTEADLKAHDGQVVRLVGVYKPLPVPRKKAGPPVYMGHAAIVVGDRWVRLGKAVRSDAEHRRWNGKPVAVTGRFVFRPPMELPPHVAQPLPPPTLYEFGEIEAAR